jgi:hypothetical protein
MIQPCSYHPQAAHEFLGTKDVRFTELSLHCAGAWRSCWDTALVLPLTFKLAFIRTRSASSCRATVCWLQKPRHPLHTVAAAPVQLFYASSTISTPSPVYWADHRWHSCRLSTRAPRDQLADTAPNQSEPITYFVRLELLKLAAATQAPYTNLGRCLPDSVTHIWYISPFLSDCTWIPSLDPSHSGFILPGLNFDC